ncbi:VRR-NUC domain-containing protein [Salinicola acroporae]|uniref:phosphodiesterase I n=1 Tax=Salinicola acroporae TaxID=1541440 RepID=A0ABT6I7E7_9GAMM|nr:VRR-NUC domain-containing protein [Salinicola acroporae]MDH4573433.1 nuclease [Salinicola acroporae]
MALPTLEDPLYYLANFRRVLDWLTSRYADVLSVDEAAFIDDFERLPQPSQALLVRMIMRRGVDFRASRLDYVEIGDTRAAAGPLIAAGWIEEGAPLSPEALFALTTRPEIAAHLGGWLATLGVSRSAAKGAWLAVLQSASPEPRPLAEWAPKLEDRHYRLGVDAMCERFRLMFFGNLRQQWSEFVLAELGVYRFETVELEATSRAFSRRQELEAYHHLHRCRERFEADEAMASLLADIPREPFTNEWLERRRGRLIYKLAYRLERQGELDQALSLYRESSAPEARLRQVRVLEVQQATSEALALAERAAANPVSAAEHQALERVLPRLRRKLGQAPGRRPEAAKPPRLDLVLPRASSVERAVAQHLCRDEAPVCYVENALVNGLFGLLCWEAIFAPLPGAFFHPFHSGPVDLFEADFQARRRDRFDNCLAALETGDHAAIIRRRYREKWGTQSPFVFWEALDEHLLELALQCIPVRHLRLWFERLLGDVRANRAGMPDLIQFWPQGGDPSQATQDATAPAYRMIEVKGPGDRLQDNQKRWLEFCARHDMPVSVCYVTWDPEDDIEAPGLPGPDTAVAGSDS